MESASPEGSHRIQFYDDPEVLARRIAGFLRDALDRGGASIAIARPDVADAIERELAAQGLDVADLHSRGRLVIADAEATLSRFFIDSQIDRERFRACVGGLLDQVRAVSTGLVHVYGEMVDVLWARGLPDMLLELELQWGELAREQPFELWCGYRLGAPGKPRDVARVPAFCAAHDRVEVAASEVTELSSIVTLLEQRARTLESEIARRERLEQRMLRLVDVTSELARATTREQVARIVVKTGAVAVAATSASLWLREGDQLCLAASTYPMVSATVQYERIPVELDAPVSEAARTGSPVYLGSLAEYRERYPASSNRVASTLPPEFSMAALPVACGGATLGVLFLTYDHVREFGTADRAFKAVVARQCALALERVKLHEEERAAAAAERIAREESELLYELISRVNAIGDLEAVYELTLDATLRGSHCDRAAILLFDPDGTMRFKASRGLSETYRAAVEGHSPWRPDARDPAPVSVDDTETDPAWASYREVFRAEGIRALAFVPLIHQRRLIGKLMLYRNTPRAFAAREIQLTATIAVHVAQAVERTRAERELERAYREERDARMLADEATRAREEILSVVSHDLRNPLGTVMMGASTLLSIELGDKSQRVRTVADRIHRQAERMARMIDDLVDFAGIQAGRLALTRKSHAPGEIITAARELFGPLANERGLAFEARIAPDLPAIDCDSERALQVLSNLVTNALKVTPRGGRIAIGAEPRDHEIVFFVRDTGPGIEADELPKLFERFWRSKQSQYKGAGLGLSIARGIVDAHGGRIWAESQPGAGSTFYFSLSSLRNN
jgi:signal transduction histidine kinase